MTLIWMQEPEQVSDLSSLNMRKTVIIWQQENRNPFSVYVHFYF